MNITDERIRRALVDVRKLAIDSNDSSTAMFIEAMLKGKFPDPVALSNTELDDFILWLEPCIEKDSEAKKYYKFLVGLARGLLD